MINLKLCCISLVLGYYYIFARGPGRLASGRTAVAARLGSTTPPAVVLFRLLLRLELVLIEPAQSRKGLYCAVPEHDDGPRHDGRCQGTGARRTFDSRLGLPDARLGSTSALCVVLTADQIWNGNSVAGCRHDEGMTAGWAVAAAGAAAARGMVACMLVTMKQAAIYSWSRAGEHDRRLVDCLIQSTCR
jgi:hypothetical protein